MRANLGENGNHQGGSPILARLGDRIVRADCRALLPTIPSNSIDLVVTSPPYADRRKKTYGGVSADEYVDWFLPVSHELLRILKPSGSFVLNIKEPADNGERHTYVIELILGMRKQGWLWTEEYIWHKKNCYPGKWPNRFRDAWERCLHFTRQPRFKMNQMGIDWARTRLRNLSEADRKRDESKVESGFGKNVSNWLGRKTVYPTNVLHMATECSNRKHSATFPINLPKWFIRLFTEEGDLVLDPFLGSGTTALACIELRRHYIGIELQRKYYDIARETVKKAKYAKAEQFDIAGAI